MKIFTQNPDKWSEKINFVDENNVFLGYDMGQSCCEHADWFIDDKPWTEQIPDNLDAYQKTEGYEGWTFDTSYFLEVANSRVFDEGGMAIFKITKDGNEKFIDIFNSHNGYYGHGFEFHIGNEPNKNMIKASGL